MSSLGERQTGSIKWFNWKKMYGFITADASFGSAEYFFHRSAVASAEEPWNIRPGVAVEYSLEKDDVGRLRAIRVIRLVGSPARSHANSGKDALPASAAFSDRRGKQGYISSVYDKKCYHCGEMGHIKVHCPRKPGPSSLRDSNVGRYEFPGRRDRALRDADCGLRPGIVMSGNDDDCVILEDNPCGTKEGEKNTNLILDRMKLFDFFSMFSMINSGKVCKREEDSDKEENSDDCVLLENNRHEEDSDDDCVILDKNPFEEDIHETIVNMPKKLSLTSDVVTMYSVQQSSDSKLQSFQGKLESSDHDDELKIVAERGQVACRDYPHSRHLCAKHPFKSTPHQTYCNLCYCYVCDIRAPCKYWEAEEDGHCHASELEFKWKEMRVLNRVFSS